MGASGSVVVQDMNMALDGSDVDTPRGVTAKAEVVRLRSLIVERGHQAMEMLARARFTELDVDHNGYLENAELHNVVEWVMKSFGNKLGTDPAAVQEKMMARLDANKDGKLDMNEFEVLFKEMINRMMLLERARAKFNEFDSNKNGFIDNAEIKEVVDWTLQAYPSDDVAVYREQLMNNIDANKDGQLDLQEFTTLFEDMLVRCELIEKAKNKFKELDVDSSGYLEKQEIDTLVDWVLQYYIERPPEDRQRFKVTLLAKVDVNKDGKLDLLEFTNLFNEVLSKMDLIERAKVQFQKLDVNSNGYLEGSELTAILEKWATANNKALGDDSGAVLAELIKSVDYDLDGKVNLLEFVKVFEQIVSA